jgi:hypothetical protein
MTTARTDRYFQLIRELDTFDAENNRYHLEDPRRWGDGHETIVCGHPERERICGELEAIDWAEDLTDNEVDILEDYTDPVNTPPDWGARCTQALAQYVTGHKGRSPTAEFCEERGYHQRAREEVGKPEFTCMYCYSTLPAPAGCYSVLLGIRTPIVQSCVPFPWYVDCYLPGGHTPVNSYGPGTYGQAEACVGRLKRNPRSGIARIIVSQSTEGCSPMTFEVDEGRCKDKHGQEET